MAGEDSARNGAGGRFGAGPHDPFLRRGERLGLAGRRAELLRRARGQVVEIGAGTGLHVRPYPPTAQGTLTQAVRAMSRRLEKRVRAHAGMRPVRAAADELPMADASVD